jgi:sterol desaturase/sphingolipid hydroxylase (fatty acid hydroxylase superfamily)
MLANYSVGGISSHLLHMPQFIITWVTFFGIGVAIYLTYIISNGNSLPLMECLGLDVFRELPSRKSLYMDVNMYVVRKILDVVMVVPFVATNISICNLVVSAAGTFSSAHGFIHFNYLWASACTIFMFLVEELGEYAYHFAEHKIPVLWEFHKVHHSAHQLNPLTAKRIHPISLLFSGTTRGVMTGIAAGGLVIIFGISATEALALSLVASKIFIIATLDPLKHSHFRIGLGAFDRLLISPHMHQIHHSKAKAHWDKNFGTTISLFDWMFGTAYKPSKGEQPIYGISGYSKEKIQAYNTLYGAYIAPFVKAAHIVRGYVERGAKKPPIKSKNSAQAGEPPLDRLEGLGRPR